MSGEALACLVRQFETASSLAAFHLAGLTTEECLWRPAERGLHVHREGEVWRADWPDRETYDIGPPSIAWITWHIDFWWSMVLAHSRGDRNVRREDIVWAGSAQHARARIHELDGQWRSLLGQLDQADLLSKERTHWPFTDRPFADVVAWVSIELTKNASEIGYARFLYAARNR